MLPKSDLDEIIQLIAKDAYGMSMNAIWRLIGDRLDFFSRKERFLKVLDLFLEKEIVKLGREGRILEGENNELLRQFDSSWPAESDFYDDQFSTVVPYRVEVKKRLQNALLDSR